MSNTTVVYGNIKSNPMMKLAQAEADIEKAFDLAAEHEAQEIHLTEMVPSYRAIAKRLAKAHGYTLFSAGNETILTRSDIKLGRRMRRLFTKGVKAVMPNVMMASVRLLLPIEQVFAGTHYAPKWWWRPKSNSINNRLARRQIAATKRFLASKYKAGVPVVLVGDLNTPHELQLGKGQALLAPIKNVMHAYAFAPAGYEIKKVAHGSISTAHLHTDHQLGWATFEVTKVKAGPAPSPHLPPSPPFIAARWHGGKQTPKTIVIHGTVSPCRTGQARATAQFFAQRPATGKTSAHYSVDPAEVYQSVGDHVVAYHCGHNQDSIGIELCDPQTGFGARWSDANHKAMLKVAATLVAELCLAYKIPAIRVTPSALKAGKHGICGHVDMSLAFHQSTHTDPGPDFPWTDFIHDVKSEIARLK